MTQPDWHPADIIAGLRKKGTSLAEVSRRAGLASSTLANALTRSSRAAKTDCGCAGNITGNYLAVRIHR